MPGTRRAPPGTESPSPGRDGDATVNVVPTLLRGPEFPLVAQQVGDSTRASIGFPGGFRGKPPQSPRHVAFCLPQEGPFGAEFAETVADRGESRSGYRPSTQSVRGNETAAQILRDLPDSGVGILPGLRGETPGEPRWFAG